MFEACDYVVVCVSVCMFVYGILASKRMDNAVFYLKVNFIGFSLAIISEHLLSCIEIIRFISVRVEISALKCIFILLL